MSNVIQAIDFVLAQEDAEMTGVVTDTAGDNGGRTRWGISERWHPHLSETGFYDTMTRADSLATAEGIYLTDYAKPMLLAAITSQAVATALLSFAVVTGVKTAVSALQETVTAPVDGSMGPMTIMKVNQWLERPLLDAFVTRQKVYFNRVAMQPGQGKFLRGWLNRASAFESLLA